MKILIIRYFSASDVILSTPVIRNLKVQLDAEIHYLTSIQSKDLLSANPYLEKIYYDYEGGKVISELQQEGYDCVVDLQKNRKSILTRLKLGVKTYAIKKLNVEKWLLVNLKINQMPDTHVVDLFMNAVKPLGVKKDLLGLDYFIQDKDKIDMDWLPVHHHKGFTAIALSANYNTRKLPKNKLIELCDKINKPVILLGQKEDFQLANEVADFFTPNELSEEFEIQLTKLGKKTIVFNACGIYNIGQMASIIKMADYVFTYDSEFLQIAAAFKKDVYSIWGNTLPLFGTYPYKTKFKIFENNKIDCRPCTTHGFKKCPKKHFKCMNDIVFDFYLP